MCLGSLENMGLESLGCSQEGHRSRDAGVGGDGCSGGGEGGMLTHLGGVLGCRRGCGLWGGQLLVWLLPTPMWQ